jgi:hypothetical protein
MLLVLDPSKHILKLLERIQHGFLWVARPQANGGNCHVNWLRVCRPISLGGLARTGLALRLRWLWYSRVDSGRAWSGLDLEFTTEEHGFFFASTHMTIGNGHLTLFWEDRWIDGRGVKEIAP